LKLKVKRIVANVEAQTPAAAKCFYQDVLGLEVLMDLGWIAPGQKMNVQISFMSQGGSDRFVDRSQRSERCPGTHAGGGVSY